MIGRLLCWLRLHDAARTGGFKGYYSEYRCLRCHREGWEDHVGYFNPLGGIQWDRHSKNEIGDANAK